MRCVRNHGHLYVVVGSCGRTDGVPMGCRWGADGLLMGCGGSVAGE